MLSNFILALLLHVPSVAYQFKDYGVRTAISAADKAEETFWPFDHIFGGGKTAGGPYKQPLENLGDTEYFGIIQVGGKKIKAIIDTGSFELLVFDVNCSICGSHQDLYDSSKSKTSTVSDVVTKHSFGSGTTYSREVIDKVKIGQTTISNQSFWAVFDADMFILDEGNFQAIFGVGPPKSAIQFAIDDDKRIHKELKHLKKSGANITDRMKEIVAHYDDMADYMKTVISVAENLNTSNMSICLGQKSKSPGHFIWDDDELQKHPESFLTTDVIGDYYWSTKLGDVHLAGAVVQEAEGEDNVSKKLKKLANETIDLGCPKANCSAIVDTGTSLLVAPTRVVNAIYDLAHAWDLAGGTCEDLSQLPELRFKLNGATLALPPEAYMGYISGSPYDDLAEYMPRFFDKHQLRKNQTRSLSKHRRGKKYQRGNTLNKGGHEVDEDSYSSSGTAGEISYCEPLVMSINAESQFGELWILGLPFFRKYYTTFSFSNDRSTPEPATMSFSEQDGKCNPGMAPQPIEETPLQKSKLAQKSGIDSSPSTTTSTEDFLEPRRAQLKVDASKILVPSLLRKLDRNRKANNLMRPFVHI